MRPDYTGYAEFPNDTKPMLCSIVINALDSALIAEIISFAEGIDACKACPLVFIQNDGIDHGWLPYVNSCLTKKELKLPVAKLINLDKRDFLQILTITMRDCNMSISLQRPI
ncbi:dynein heavy chain [Echinococcus multilocularis]|uniref:Dynein heavy chain n=1 Tax=Echinococcus multilocularis TaxID=6211 RepID=A0A0S4MJ17_ECHMU|nr:dynein heavy chain [Echinococcus multilocularis]